MDSTATPTLTAARGATTAPPRPSGAALSGVGARVRGMERRTAQRLGLAALLVATAALYLADLGASGWANSFYAAAAQAGSESWKAFFFGSSDAGNAITVDKTPLSLWPMALSIRVFGLSSWSLLVPQALMGVASVALLHSLVRRTTGSYGAGLLAGATLALTPVATLMFRFDNPDALLVLLMVGAAWATLRAVEASTLGGTGRPVGHPVRWLALAGALVGLAFLTKMLQAFLVLPALAAAYTLFATAPWVKRIGHLLVAFGSMVVAGGWWVAIVELVPAGSRPYIGGSQENSILELTLGYNGLGRLNGEETGSVGGGGGWGTTGIGRMFSETIGGQIAWLLPAALLLGGAALWFARRRGTTYDVARGRSVRASLVLWLGWLLVTGLTFSFMAGIFHEYYTVALAPAVAALVGIGAVTLWRARRSLVASGLLGFTVALTSAWAFVLLQRAGDWHPWLKYVVAVVGIASALLLVGVRHLPARVGYAVATTALLAGLAGPAAYSLATAATPHEGSIVTAGPASAASGPGGMGGPGATGGGGGMPGATPGGTAPTLPGGTTGTAPGGQTGGQTGGGVGGLLSGSESTDEITALLQEDASTYTWAAAAVGSNSAAGYQLASEEPVMAIGGFNGSDPSPTLEEFQTYVANGDIHWFIAGGGQMGGMGQMGGTDGATSTASAISAWVESTFTATTVDGVTLYDLSVGVR
ncbi:ArnT family glycosyltransferase [Nocardioides alkalitolerans]|uniref:ArnT family glycosyltransferase n=1 Tax=Nocardioides alkalitolerans TaxID=281714 RepID=UPI0003F650FA|nr:glycosyltransferase family 39 protein [Nocardioides alkalitolerans]